jgi:asparagine synthase (glutamine-hydrolysing)
MCGILGGLNTDFDEIRLERLRHRGPDQAAMVLRMVPPFGEIALGQTRLNIVDRGDIELPVTANGASIVFNGEIYNHSDLRRELCELGWTFQTRTDIEVALAAYLQWGADCLRRFNGMFSLAIWDGERFFLARDRLGKKPLFYRTRSGSFEFASEIKVFSDLEFASSDLFDLFEFCFNGHTLFRGIHALPPAHYLVFDPTRGTCDTHRYWDIEHRVDRRITEENRAVDQFIELLEDAVRLRLRADVDVSLFLSGGVDSALIASLALPNVAFTCQFDEFLPEIDEARYAADLAARLGLDLHMVRPTREQFFQDLPSLAYHLEMPTGSFSVFPLYRLAAAARAAGFKVVLTGEGSDELFAGYVRNEWLLNENGRGIGSGPSSYTAMLGRYRGSDLDRFCRMASRSGLGGAAAMKMFLTEYWNDRMSLVENICCVETSLFLQPLLQMNDRMTMAHGVEARCPFLDHRVVEFAFSLDDTMKFRDGTGKWIVHAAARKLLPRDALVLSRTVKHGLPTPVNLWMQGRHGFDRRYWNTLLTAECVKALVVSRGTVIREKSSERARDIVGAAHDPVADVPILQVSP